MDGIKLTPLKIIKNPKGNISHAIKMTADGFSNFGEAYFTEIRCGEIKGWKLHKRMVLNLVVPVGKVQFVVYNNETFFTTTLSKKNYQRLTIEPNMWVAFKGISENLNLILNVANIEHDPNESINKDLQEIRYAW